MLERVVDTLQSSPEIGAIEVSIDEPSLLQDVPRLARQIEAGELGVLASTGSVSRSVLAALEPYSDGSQVLITTADHALLSHEMIEYFLRRARASSADVVVGLVSASLIRQRFPQAKRTFLRFADESYSGANLFCFRLPGGRRALEFWTRVESQRKQPWRLVKAFGLGTLLPLKAAFERASRAIGVPVEVVELPFAEAAVDVDKLSDLELVREILSR
jgi:CTP:molybdopterin cytidylyltransferase MocA